MAGSRTVRVLTTVIAMVCAGGMAPSHAGSSEDWSFTGPLAADHVFASATTLSDDRVLVMGGTSGCGGDGPRTVEIYSPASNEWSTGTPPPFPLARHQAVALADGRVLVAGGTPDCEGTRPTAQAALYDPAANTWAPAPPMATPRMRFAATHLSDGRVLVTGGGESYPDTFGDFRPSASAEIFDPSTGEWVVVSPMLESRFKHTATLLRDGTVLVVGGVTHMGGVFNDSNRAEIYDPLAGAWIAVAPMIRGRSDHTATLLADGRVLVTGGVGVGLTDPGSNGEVYDPVTEQWTPVSNMMSAPRAFHAAAAIGDGRILLAGGREGPFGNNLRTADVYNPATNTFAPTGFMARTRIYAAAVPLGAGRILVAGGTSLGDRRAEIFEESAFGSFPARQSIGYHGPGHVATRLRDGRVLVAGGSGDCCTGGRPAHPVSEIYDPATDRWSATAPMLETRGFAASVRAGDGRVLVAGGFGAADVTRTTELFDPELDVWFPGPPMAYARFAHSAVALADGAVLVPGGPVNPSEIYRPGASWTPAAPMSMDRRYASAVLLTDGRVLVAGGYGYDRRMTLTAEVYDPAAGTWSTTGPMHRKRLAAAAVVLPDGRVLVTGGDEVAGSALRAEIYDPETNRWTEAAEGGPSLGYGGTSTLLPDGRVLVIEWSYGQVYDPARDAWSQGAELITQRYYHSATALDDGSVLLAGGWHEGIGLASAERYRTRP